MKFNLQKRNIFKIIVILSLIIPFLTFFEFTAPVKAATNIYYEDFTNTTFMDASITNVTGWSTSAGEISLPHKDFVLTGSYTSIDECWDVYVSGDYVYIADGVDGFKVIDIGDPSNPILVGSCSSPSFRLYVSGDYAFVGDRWGGFRVINITDPTSPAQVGTCSTPGNAYDVYVSGDYAYVADDDEGLCVIDVSDPTNPISIASCDTSGNSYDIYVSGDYAYLADRTAGLQAINISDPTNPVLAGTYDTENSANGVFISGNYAFVADMSGGLKIINITDPTNPNKVGSYDTPNSAYDVYVSGDYAYVANQFYGLRVINVTELTNPIPVGFCETTGIAYNVDVSGCYAYVANNIGGLKIIKVSDPVTPTIIGSCGTPYSAKEVVVSGNIAYVADGDSGLQVINITDNRNPSIIGSWSTYAALDVFVSGDFAYIAADIHGLQVINITDPTNPILAGSETTSGHALGVHIFGNYAYIADEDSTGLDIFDISNPTNPILIRTYTIVNGIDIFIHGNYAYLAREASGLSIIDISDPSNPSTVSSYSTNNAVGIYVTGNFAYVADGSFGVKIIDISDPTDPFLAGSWDSPAYVRDIHVSGNFAYVADGNSGVQIINVSDPSTPIYVDSCDTSGNAYGVYVDGNHVFVADGASGLQIVEVMENRVNIYESLAIAQSLEIYSGDFITLIHSTLTCSDNTPLATSINYYLSSDNGVNWEEVTPSLKHEFVYDGHQLKWKAVLNTTDPQKTPKLYSLSISSTSALDPPIILAPEDSSVINDNTPYFEWDSVTGAINYLIQIDSSMDFDSGDLINESVSSTSYTPSVILSDGIWYWRVAANDSEGDLGIFSSVQNVEIDTTPPQVPLLETPSNNTFTSNMTPVFTWNSVPDAVNYTIQLDTIPDFNSLDLITTTGIVSTSFTPSSPLSENTWYWRVRAFDHLNNQGNYSSPFTLTIDTTNPETPLLISPCNNTYTQNLAPTLEWTSVPGAANYTVQLDTIDDFSSPDLIIATGILSTDFTPSSSLAESPWYWRVCAYDNANNQGNYSVIFKFTTDITKPGTPSIISPITNSHINDSTPTLIWSNLIEAQTYKLQLDTTVFYNSSNLITILGINSTSYEILTPLAEGAWGWRVCAFDAADNQGNYAHSLFTIDITPPGIPFLESPINDTYIIDATPIFSWSYVMDCQKFCLQLDTSDSFSSPNLIVINDVHSTLYELVTTLADNRWYWRVCAFDSANNKGNFSNPMNFTLDTNPPNIDSPPDISFQVGSSNNRIIWNPSDINPYIYSITREGGFIHSGPWNGSQIIFNIEDLAVGSYIYNCTVYDKAGNSVSDLVIINVNQAPFIPGYDNYLLIIISITCMIALISSKKRLKLNL